MKEQEALYKYALRLGDDALILSYRLSEWCSNGPILEEDLALTNMALDLLGRAQAFLSMAATLEGKGKTADDLAYKRGERSFYNRLIMEYPNGNFADTMARQLYVSAFEYFFFTRLQHSSNDQLAAIAAKTLKEVKYHLSHASDWVIRLGDGTAESHAKMQAALDDLWMFTGELFEMDEVDTLVVDWGMGVNLEAVKADWEKHIGEVLQQATLQLPNGKYMQSGSQKGVHTEHLGHILSEMQYLQRAYPDATW